MSRLEELIVASKDLSHQERDQLAAHLAFASRESEASRITTHERAVYDMLITICEIRVRRGDDDFDAFLAAYGRRKYATRVEDILAFVRGDRRLLLRRVQLHGLIDKCLRCLASELRARNIPITPRTLMDNIASLPHAIDRRFPGYVRAGMLHRIVG